MSARNLALSLTSPSYSVLVKVSATSASSTGASRFTCASFQTCSSTISLFSASEVWARAWPAEPSASRRKQQKVRIMSRTYPSPPHVKRTPPKHNSPSPARAMQKHEWVVTEVTESGLPLSDWGGVSTFCFEFRNARVLRPSKTFGRRPPLKRPAQQRGPNRKSRAHGRQHHQASLFQLALLNRRIHGQRNRAGGGVAVSFDIDDHTLWP